MRLLLLGLLLLLQLQLLLRVMWLRWLWGLLRLLLTLIRRRGCIRGRHRLTRSASPRAGTTGDGVQGRVRLPGTVSRRRAAVCCCLILVLGPAETLKMLPLVFLHVSDSRLDHGLCL